MADKRRFELFAAFIKEAFPSAPRVYDVAGGMGRLNHELTLLGLTALTFDARRKHLPVAFAERRLSLDEPCACDLVVGMHPDGATRIIIEYAARHRIPFAVVPCCSDNGMSYKPWMKHLAASAAEMGFEVAETALPMAGRSRVLLGRHSRGR
ncbi:MAG: hypothetical protein HYV15_06785 [Elusimicrobia bacterium]|nr:hypothetical protein [Elusimicrobiota bacterium]